MGGKGEGGEGVDGGGSGRIRMGRAGGGGRRVETSVCEMDSWV